VHVATDAPGRQPMSTLSATRFVIELL